MNQVTDQNHSLPRMAAALMPREILTWALVALALGALEGGLLGVIVKHRFESVVPDIWVNVSVALVAGAPAFANVVSFLVAAYALGKDKIFLLSHLLQVIAVSLLLMSLADNSFAGLLLFCSATILGRMAWSGVLTVRAAVWRANYVRSWRGRVTGRLAQISSLLIAASAALIGWAMDWHPQAYRWLFVMVAISALMASLVYRRARMRRQRQLLEAELAERLLEGRGVTPGRMLGVLKANRDFRRYMLGMMVFGSGNLMIIAQLVVIMTEVFDFSRLHLVALTSSVPLAVLCFSIPFWARFLDQKHIFDYRAIHSWFFVAAFAVFSIGLVFEWSGLFWLASALLGAAYAGGELGWNLGHNDFANDAQSSLYMATHVTLTGLRGLIMPLLGIWFYQWLQDTGGYGRFATLLPLTLSAMGAAWFVWLSVSRRRQC